MAREIKFRTWDKQKEKMNDIGVHIFFTDNGELVFRDANYHYIDDYPSYENEKLNERFELMQFVRTDTDRGVSIDFYENDVVEIKMPYQDNNLKAVIFYEKQNCSFRAKVYMNGGIYLHDLTVLTVVKVLGNIYENPELLK